MSDEQPFWEVKSLREMSRAEWESLCDGCGKCCLHTLEDEDTGEFLRTAVACTLLDEWECRCSDYANRFERVPDCVRMSVKVARSADWLPKTCAYRLVAEGKSLRWWHHLVSGSRETIHLAGMSVRGRVISEDLVDDEDRYFEYPFDYE